MDNKLEAVSIEVVLSDGSRMTAYKEHAVVVMGMVDEL